MNYTSLKGLCAWAVLKQNCGFSLYTWFRQDMSRCIICFSRWWRAPKGHCRELLLEAASSCWESVCSFTDLQRIPRLRHRLILTRSQVLSTFLAVSHARPAKDPRVFQLTKNRGDPPTSTSPGSRSRRRLASPGSTWTMKESISWS